MEGFEIEQVGEHEFMVREPFMDAFVMQAESLEDVECALKEGFYIIKFSKKGFKDGVVTNVSKPTRYEGMELAEKASALDRGHGFIVCPLPSKSLAAEYVAEHFPPRRRIIPPEVRQRVFDKYNGHCAYCGCEIEYERFHVDHLISYMYHKGEDGEPNFMPACRDCNLFKSALTLEEFREKIRTKAYAGYAQSPFFDSDSISCRIAKKYGLDENPNAEIAFLFEKCK